MRECALILVLILFICGCGSTAAPTPTPVTGDSGVHLLVALEGNLSVKRQGWSDYTPALFGMVLRSGDLLRLEGTAQATVACADLTLVRASGGISSVPCKVNKPVLAYGSSLINPTRANIPTDIPIVLSPRKTKVISPRPTIRWAPVAGVSIYKVTVRGPNLTWSADVTEQTTLVYPDVAPALSPGASYKVTVMAGNRTSDEESGAGLGFTVLKTEEAQAVRNSEGRIRSLGLSNRATRLLIANLYASQGLHAEAIEILEDLSQEGNEPAIARSLADLYVKVGLNRLAEQMYLQALQLSQKVGDIEGQAAAYNALGLVYEVLGNKAEAVQHSQKAIEWYQKLGDTQMVKQIQGRLSALQKP